MCPPKFSAEPLVDREFIVNTPLMVLMSVRCSAGLEAEDTEPAKDLTKELCSTRLEAEPSPPVKLAARPLVPAPAIPREAVRDLNSDAWSEKLEEEPIDAP
jgi:hypothetical protein